MFNFCLLVFSRFYLTITTFSSLTKIRSSCLRHAQSTNQFYVVSKSKEHISAELRCPACVYYNKTHLL